MIEFSPAILVLAAVCLGLVADTVRTRRRLAAHSAAHAGLARRLATLEGDIGALLSCSRRIGERIGDAERTDRTLQKQIDKLRFHGEDSQVAVEHAMKLLATGLEMKEVTRVCELTEGEVEILQNLSRFRSAA